MAAHATLVKTRQKMYVSPSNIRQHPERIILSKGMHQTSCRFKAHQER
jgi:ribosomal protein L33